MFVIFKLIIAWFLEYYKFKQKQFNKLLFSATANLVIKQTKHLVLLGCISHANNCDYFFFFCDKWKNKLEYVWNVQIK